MATIAELGARVKARYPGKYDDLSDQEVGARVKQKYPSQYADFEDAPAGPGLLSGQPLQTELRPGRGPVARGLGLLPTAGGVVGSVLGGTAGLGAGGVGAVPGAVAGAGAGGAGGEAWKQVAEQAIAAAAPQFAREQGIAPPETSGSAARQIGLAAAEQAAYDAAGHGLARAAAKAGGLPMQAAIRSGSDVAATAIRERVAATKGGLKKVLLKTRESGSMLRAMLNHADRTTGIQFRAPDLADEIGRRLIPKVEDSPTRGADWRTISVYARRFMNDFGRGPMTFAQLQRVKQRADAISAPLWKKIEANEPVSGSVKARALWFKEMGDHFRDLLERTVPPRIDARTGRTVTVAEQNAVTQEYIRLSERLRKTVKPGGGFGARVAQRGAGVAAGATVGASLGAATGSTPQDRMIRGAEGAVAGGVAGSPAVLSLASLAMTHPMLAAILSHTLRTGGAIASDVSRE